MIFYLGTHMPNFVEQVNIPWFISVNRVLHRKSRLIGNWILDSGGFTQIAKYGEYQITEQEYLSVIDRQKPLVAFCQDWMCEPQILEKTGLTVKDHQQRTTDSYLGLSSFSDKVRPVIQGWKPFDYVQHLKDYRGKGVNLNQLFGVGTVCSRNGNPTITRKIFQAIIDEEPNIKLHGFGIKTDSLVASQDLLWSADSMAWCFEASKNEKICGDKCPVKNCSNCLEYALLWRKKNLYFMKNGGKVMAAIKNRVNEETNQMDLFPEMVTS